MMENQYTHFEAPTSANVTVAMKRPREYLTEKEIERMMDTARQNRWGHRDAPPGPPMMLGNVPAWPAERTGGHG
jgi:hypothetical protein